MPALVTLMPPAKRKLQSIPEQQVQKELAVVFSDADAVSVYDVLQGFHADQRHKLILAVEITKPSGSSRAAVFESHVVKLGSRDEVEADVRGWQRCTEGRFVARRMFVPVELVELPHDSSRTAIVYRDAAQWSGLLTPGHYDVATLAWAFEQAVFHPHGMDFGSVERTIRQVFAELGRVLYEPVSDEPLAAINFFRAKLRLDRDDTVHRWRSPAMWQMRRDVDWLLCGGLSPAGGDVPEYVDPYDFVLAMLERNQLPATLTGRTHGDLHADNIIVGVAGDEVEYPLLIDYGDMAVDNVIAWDFVKLETELKVRLLIKLFQDAASRGQVLSHLPSVRLRSLVDRWDRGRDANSDPTVSRTQQIAFAYGFEKLLYERSRETGLLPRRPQFQIDSATPAVDRALILLQTIRYMAGEQLGQHHARDNCWSQELEAAIAIYGLNTVKFSDTAYPPWQRLFTLVSAGMAAARLLPGMQEESAAESAACLTPLTYHAPLRRAYRRWKANDQIEIAERELSQYGERFDYAVPFIREHALIQAKLGSTNESMQRLLAIAEAPGPWSHSDQHDTTAIVSLCEAFLETEVLARLGRIFKDKADAAWEKLDVDFAALQGQPPTQFYRSAHRLYRKAYDLTLNYYPGGNAAVTGLLCGDEQGARDVAEQVALTCKTIDISRLSGDDAYWVLATEGDMALLRGRGHDAAGFYREALEQLSTGNDGMAQTTYDQLCRLYRALPEQTVRPVLEVFRDHSEFTLRPGRLGDCGGLLSTLNSTR